MKQLLNSHEQQTHPKALWYRALALAERAILLPKNADAHAAETTEVGEKREHARQRFQRWKEQPPFNRTPYFAQRLAADTLTEEDLLTLLAESDEQRQDRLSGTTLLPWLTAIIDAFAQKHALDTSLLQKIKEKRIDYKVSFLDAVEPLINNGLLRLQKGVQELAHIYTYLPFDSAMVLPLLLNHIPNRLSPKFMKTLVLELNIARVQGQLQGENAEARFQYFIQQLTQQEGMLPLLEEYTVLARLLAEAVEQWVNYSLGLLTHLCADWQEIRQTMGPVRDLGRLTRIRAGQGDTQRGGQNVTILTWSSGFQLVYKPRTLSIDVHFQELLSWLNQHGFQPGFQTIKVVSKDTHGWVEFVHASSCSSYEQVQRFYERQGGYLALLYALEAVDFYGANLIAAGEHPILIDLEGLFHPTLDTPDSIATPGFNALERCVLRTGLLPQRICSIEQGQGIDISGLGGSAGQMTPTRIQKWAGVGTDTMQLHLEQIEMEIGLHRPKLQDHDVDTLEFCGAIITGFQTVYRLLLQHRQELLTEILPHFANAQTRCLLRTTDFYNLLLENSYHPDILRDALDRDRFFDRLWVDVEFEPKLAQVIPLEKVDLLKGDIPIFTTTPNSQDIMTCRGEVIPAFFAKSGFASVTDLLKSLDEQDLERQIWCIKAAFASLAPTAETQLERWVQLNPSSSSATPERLLAAAKKIGDRLSATALHANDMIEWLGLVQVNSQEWQVLTTDADLYNGTSGIALFFAYLAQLTGEETYLILTKQLLQTTRIQIKKAMQQPEFCQVGAFTGMGAFIYLLTHLGTLWNDQTLYREAEELIPQFAQLIPQDTMLDLAGGTAGFLLALLALYAVAPSSALLTIAIQCGEYLLAQTQLRHDDISWSRKADEIPLTGFSRGNSGIALSLFRLASVSGEERFRQTALAALACERKYYSSEKRNWPDLREVRTAQHEKTAQPVGNIEATYMVAWCHGAPGMALARLGLLPDCDDDKIHDEIDAALQTTLAEGFGANHSLCHGDMGNLDILLSAQQLLTGHEYHEHVQHLSAMLLHSIETQGWITGIPQGLETPGLMTGLAGIGYTLLRLVAPWQVPSVLLLDPPINSLP